MLAKTPATIVQGERAVIRFLITDLDTKLPFDLTAKDKFLACIELASGSFLSITETPNANGSSFDKLGSSLLGQLELIIGPADTNLLRLDELLNIGYELDNATTPDPLRRNIEKALFVEPFDC